MPAIDLAGVRVLVTRPESQAGKLIESVRRAGGEPVPFPTLEIAPREPDPSQIEHLARSDTVIFISANAVTHGYPFMRNFAVSEKRIIAIGRATEQALQTMGCHDVYSAAGRSSSEDLLERAILSEVENRRICIVRGQNGRELLQKTLIARGAHVAYLECYRRRLPANADDEILIRTLGNKGENLVVSVTSVTGLLNLLLMAPDKYRQRLVSGPLVVIGGRQKAAALQNGWLGPVLESAASDEQIVKTIVEWRSQHD
ncbi:MAG: Uroporphyrinogen-III synthase [Gammaproteobacteria bacterium]|nr:Uroporphyrinogen-III synthase [Gammaproteobacteria bacterium]